MIFTDLYFETGLELFRRPYLLLILSFYYMYAEFNFELCLFGFKRTNK